MSAEIQTYYARMMNEISKHKDFGKRNPVDIGIECGYSEEDVLEMLKMLSEKMDKEETKREQDKYYFMLKKKNKGVIVSVDISTWDIKIVKTVLGTSPMPMNQWHIGKWQIKNHIFAWTQEKLKGLIKKESDGFLYWEDLETGDQRKISIDFKIQSLLIADNEIIVIPQYYDRGDEIIGYGFDGSIRKKHIDYWGGGWLLEGEDKFYGISSQRICCIDKDFENQKELWNIESNITANMSMVAAGFDESDFYCYRWKQISTGLLSFGNQYDKYTESKGVKTSISEFSSCYDISLQDMYPLEGITTKNYQLFQRKICRRKDLSVVCTFNRCLDLNNNNGGSIVGIYDKDIIIGVCEDKYREDVLMKIDLRKESTPVILPLDTID